MSSAMEGGVRREFAQCRCAGQGHALSYTIADATMTIATLPELHLHLPDSAAFRSADMDGTDVRARIAAVEGDGTP
jgi:acetolactate decarboxylase